jgi:hypothetical protein
MFGLFPALLNSEYFDKLLRTSMHIGRTGLIVVTNISIIIMYNRSDHMKGLLTFILWCILLILCWPLAILALILWPVVWLISLPFRLLGIAFDSVFALLRAVLFLPARVLGYRRHTV